LLELPEPLKQGFRDDLKRYEQERQMLYITSIERMGIADGLAQGREQERSLIFRLLNRKFGVLPEEKISELNLLPFERLESLAEELFDFTNLDDLNAWLKLDRNQ
jgi:Domain of unknown function (DUF4351)